MVTVMKQTLTVAAIVVGLTSAAEVSVQGDAVYSVPSSRGIVCIGSGSAPAGTACPLKGDIAIADCAPALRSYTGSECVAPVDAECAIVAGSAWGCVFPGGSLQTVTEHESAEMTLPSTPQRCKVGHPKTKGISENGIAKEQETPTTATPTTEAPTAATSTSAERDPANSPCTEDGPNEVAKSWWGMVDDAWLHVTSFKSCCELCWTYPTCKGFQYSPADKLCFPTSNTDPSNRETASDDRSTGYFNL